MVKGQTDSQYSWLDSPADKLSTPPAFSLWSTDLKDCRDLDNFKKQTYNEKASTFYKEAHPAHQKSLKSTNPEESSFNLWEVLGFLSGILNFCLPMNSRAYLPEDSNAQII